MSLGPNKPTPPEMVRFALRSGDHGDCVVSAIEMATGRTYEESLTACSLVAPNVLRDGMLTKDILTTLRDLGVQPRYVKIPRARAANRDFVRMIEEEELSGILTVKAGRDEHAVYVWAGRVIEPRANRRALWLDVESYLKSEGWRAIEFITFREEE